MDRIGLIWYICKYYKCLQVAALLPPSIHIKVLLKILVSCCWNELLIITRTDNFLHVLLVELDYLRTGALNPGSQPWLSRSTFL